MAVRSISRTIVVLLLVALVFGSARAADGNASLEVFVTDASNGKVIPFARVFVGSQAGGTIVYTDEAGRVAMEGLEPGQYSLATYAPGFSSKATSIAVSGGLTTAVYVALAPAGATKVIATVRAIARPTLDTTRLSASDARVSATGSLFSALTSLPDVSIRDGGLSVDGLSANAFQPTIDGVALPQGGASALFSDLGLDLFNSVSARPVGSAGGPGVDLSSSDPTIAFSTDGSLQTTAIGSSSSMLQARGTTGYVGYVARHVSRNEFGSRQGLFYLDESGLAYDHSNGQNGSGDLLKVRLPIDKSQHVLLEASRLDGSSDADCDRRSGGVPCGYGPGNSDASSFRQFVFRYGVSLGRTSVDLAIGNASSSTVDDYRARLVGGSSSPYHSSSRTFGTTYDASVEAPLGHSSVSAELFASGTSLATTIPGVVPIPRTRYTSFSLTDTFSTGPLSTIVRFQRANGASAHASVSVDSTVHLTSGDDLHARIAVGAESVTPIQTFPTSGDPADPASVQYDCLHGHAFASVPGDDPADPLDSGASLAFRHSSGRWSLRLSASSDTIHGAQVPTVEAASASPGAIDPLQLAGLQAFYASPYACGAPAPLTPSSIYLSASRNATLVQRRVSASAALAVSRSLIVAPYLSLSQSSENAGGTWESLAYAPSLRAGLLADYHFDGGRDELLTLASMTGANNANALPAYTQIDVGFARTLAYGRVIVAASNVTNASSAEFASSAFARPLPGGILPIAQPLRATSLRVTYEFHTGARVPPPSTDALTAIAASLDPSTDTFTMSFSRLPSTRPAAPFEPDTSQPSCTPELVGTARDILAAMRRREAGSEVPDPAGVRIEKHRTGGGVGFTLTFTAAVSSRAYFGCVAQHFADVDEAISFGLYVPAHLPGENDDVGFFDSRVGAYTLIESASQPRASGAPAIDLLPVPVTAPGEPFALRTTCPEKSRGFAAHVLDGLRKRLGRGGDPYALSPYFKIVQQRGTRELWSTITFFEATTLTTIETCADVVGASHDDLSSAGVGAKPGTLSFSKNLGLYVSMP